MSQFTSKNFTKQQYQLDHYEEVIAPLVYPRWYSAYQHLTRNHSAEAFYLEGSHWVESLGDFVLSAKNHLIWAISMPPLKETHRHQILNALHYSQYKGVKQLCYFNQTKLGTPHMQYLTAQQNEPYLSYLNGSSFHFSFVLADNAIVFERPSLPHHKQHVLYLIPHLDNGQMEWLLSLPYLKLSKEKQKDFLKRKEHTYE